MPFWKSKRVLITGHTGFKGSWLSLWMQQLGAEVCGYALEPPTTPSLYKDAQVCDGMRSVIADIRDFASLQGIFAEFRPEIVLHLAAQPLVRASYEDPLGTYATNVMGTANLLEATRCSQSVRAVVVVTTDKCYENKEWCWGYRESDALGGYDPYSNSKACAELVASAYRNSFFNPARYDSHQVALASVRAGNVIGGGDWASDRLIPDIFRALSDGQQLTIRNPRAVRPWQHVMEPLRGYLLVAQKLFEQGPEFGEAWNFGPEISDAKPVEWIVSYLSEIWGEGARWKVDDSGNNPHEAQLLRLDWSKAASRLDWTPALHLDEALQMTTEWYKARSQQGEMRAYTLQQIERYSKLSKFSEGAVATGSGTRS